jgi:hypothetical protein
MEVSATESQTSGENGGGRGIRTPDTLSGIAVFKTACFNRSHIPPTADKRRVINQFTTAGCCTDSQFVAQLAFQHFHSRQAAPIHRIVLDVRLTRYLHGAVTQDSLNHEIGNPEFVEIRGML